MAQKTAVNPDDRFAAWLLELQARVDRLERNSPKAIGMRDGTRQRILLGLDSSNGKYGLKIWDAAGVLQVNNEF